MKRPFLTLSFLIGVLATAPGSAAPQAAQPVDVVRDFFSAYAEKDMNALRNLFAAEAQVVRLRIASDGDGKLEKDDALKWVSKEEEDLARVTDFQLSLGEIRTLVTDFAASVSVAVETRRTERDRVIESSGISTFSLAELGGRWRIMQVSTFERER